jgi:hypothetical protein
VKDLILRSVAVGRLALGIGALVAVVAAPLLGTVAPASAQGERAGDAVVTVGGDPGTPLGAGGSATVFGLRLPVGASCQGDSAHDDYRVKSFLVPDGVDPGSLVFGELKPTADGAWSLWAESTDPYVNGLTGQADAGQPGPINNVPAFTFSVLFPGELAAGGYRIGLLCYHDDETTRYWDTAFVISADSADQPAKFRWTAPSSGGSSSGSSTDIGPWLIGGLIVVLVLLSFVWLAIRHRSPRPPHTPVQEEIS